MSMRPMSLTLGAVLADVVGFQPLFWTGDALLAIAGILGIVLLGGHDFRQQREGQSDGFRNA